MEKETRADHRATDILQIKGTHGVKISNVTLSWPQTDVRQPQWKSALHLSEVRDLFIDQLFLGKTITGHRQLVFEQVKDAVVDRVFAPHLKKDQLWQITRSANIRIGAVHTSPTKK
jgi:hypothetical protein